MEFKRSCCYLFGETADCLSVDYYGIIKKTSRWLFYVIANNVISRIPYSVMPLHCNFFVILGI